MKKGKLTLLAIVSVGLLSVLILFFMNMNIENTAMTLKKSTVAQEKVCKANFDKMWKTIKQVAGVSEKYKDAFKEIYPQLIAQRNQDKNLLFKFVTESNPTLSTALYERLASAIENHREEFFHEQEKLIDLQREHETYVAKMPQMWFLDEASRKPVEIKVITSEVTEEVYTTGQENDISL